MNNMFTKTKHLGYSLSKLAAVVLMVVGLSSSLRAQSTNPNPYCAAPAPNVGSTCDGWVAAFEKIEFNTLKFTGPGCPGANRPPYNYWQRGPFPGLSTNLAPGATYELDIQNSASTTTTMRLAGWIDWNGDNDFSDNGENIVPNTTLPFNTAVNTKATITVPCVAKPGVIRMRLRTGEDNMTAATGACLTTIGWGETFDFDITIDPPLNPTANFFLPDTVFTGSPANFINANLKGYVGHEWSTSVAGLNTVVGTKTNFSFSFPTAGTYQVRLTSTNCKGNATITKNVVVVDPTTPPTVRFLASRNYIPLAANDLVVDEIVDFLDFSTSGPTSYQWDLTPSYNLALFSPVVGTYFDKNVSVFFFDTSTYEVCLTASNAVGSAKVCKPGYVIIEYPQNSSKYENNMCEDLKSSLDSGILYDNGGKDNAYDNTVNQCSFTIDVCDAEEIEITLLSKGFGVSFDDYVRIFDGPDNTGKLLFSIGDNTALNNDETHVATSGKATIEFQTNAFNNGPGFELRWKAKLRNDGPIKAGIGIKDKLSNDSIYNCLASREVRFSNETVNTREINYNVSEHVQWIFDYDPNIAYPPGFEDVPFNNDEANPSYEYTNDKTYTVRLVVFSCEGWDTAYRTFHLQTTSMLPQVDFAATENIINAGETTTLLNKSVAWCKGEWTISPADYVIQNGGSLTDQDVTLKFDKAGRYTVKYTVENDNGQASRTRTDFIRVIEYCEPTVGTRLQSMSISRVKFGGTERISGLGSLGYQDFTQALQPIEVYIGGKYDIEVERADAVDVADRRVWIDYNRDGEFTPNEIVAQDNNSTTKVLATQVNIPDNKIVTAGITRMRVGISFAGKPFPACGPIDVGEFEDYPILLKADDVAPVITMNGADSVYIEVHTPYVDDKANAVDNIEGNITPDIITDNQVDTSQTGVYVVTYNVTDGSGNRAVPRTRFVFVVADMTKPVITVIGNTTVTHEVNTWYEDDKATALDNPGNTDLTSFIVTDNKVDSTKLGSYQVTYTVTDAYGNTSTEVRTVNVVDQTIPVINAVGGNPMMIQVGTPFVDPTTVTDNYWTNLTPTVVAGEVKTNTFGQYKVTYSAEDGSGNKAVNLTRTYIVTDLIPPVLSSPISGSEFMLVEVNDLSFVEPAVVGTDNYFPTVSIVRSGNFDITTLGDYTITYTGTDGAGNTGTFTRVIRVVDRTKPVVISTPVTVQRWQTIDLMDGVSTWDNYYAPSTFDNSGNPGTGRLEVISSNVNTLIEGLYQAIYQAVDGSGNVSDPHLRLVQVVENTTGIQDVAFGESIKVYPNPNSGKFEVEFGTMLSNNSSITITDVAGKAILNFNGSEVVNNKLTVDLSNVSAGIYFVQVQNDGKVATKKVTIAR